MANYNEKGEEIPDKKPVAMPLGYERPEPLEQMVARMVRVASNHSAALGNETLEEADDFGSEEDEEEIGKSMYQYQTMEEEYLDEESRTNPKGRTAGAGSDQTNAGKDSGEMPKSRSSDSDVEAESAGIGNKNRRSTDKARTNQRRERRQTAADSEAGRQGSRTDL